MCMVTSGCLEQTSSGEYYVIYQYAPEYIEAGMPDETIVDECEDSRNRYNYK